MTDEHRPVVAGVDTHKDTHHAAVISGTGEHLAAAQFPATPSGYRALTQFITCRGTLIRAGIEGTNSYGAGLARHLRQAGVEIVEVIRFTPSTDFSAASMRCVICVSISAGAAPGCATTTLKPPKSTFGSWLIGKRP